MNRKIRAFAYRVRDGEIIKPIYLSYYYSYLTAYDFRHGTRFSNSQPAAEVGADVAHIGTGNFPAHPRLVRRLFKAAHLSLDAPVIDIGHGSGMLLHVACRLGFKDLTGVEYGKVPYDLSVENLGGAAHLIHGDALDVDLKPFTALTFFNPFGGDTALAFFKQMPPNIKVVLTMNHDRMIEPLLMEHGFVSHWDYAHPLYDNFNAKVWKRT